MDFARLGLEVAIGLAAGLVSGLMGIGGGPLYIPAAVLLLAIDQHTAQGVSLAVIAPTALIGTLTNFRQGFVVPKTVALIGPVAIVCAVIAAQVAGMLDGVWLGRGVGVLIMFIGAKMLFDRH